MGLQDSANNQEPTGAENQDEPTGAENQDEPTGAENQDGIIFDDGEDDTLDPNAADGAADPDAADDGADPDAADPADKPADEKINQKSVNDRINKLTFEKYEERRKREALEAEHRKTLERLAELENKSKTITIPPLPDVYDPEYEAKLAERDNAIQEKAKADAAVELQQQQARAKVEAQQQAQRELVDSQIKKMQASAKKLGISDESLKQADQTVSMFIKDPAVARFILGHEDSALIVNHLGKDVSTLEKMSGMESVNSVAFLVSEVLPKAKEFKPALPSAPDPLDIPSGKPRSGKDPYLEGVTFE